MMAFSRAQHYLDLGEAEEARLPSWPSI